MLIFLVKYFRNNNFRKLYIMLLLVSSIALMSAYFMEHFLNLSPCPLCIYQRFPYLFIIKISFFSLMITKFNRLNILFIILNLILGASISFYHSGIERGFFVPSIFCSEMLHFPKNLSIDNIKMLFYSQPVSLCTKVTLRILGFSITEWNLLLNLALLIIILIIFFYPRYEEL